MPDPGRSDEIQAGKSTRAAEWFIDVFLVVRTNWSMGDRPFVAAIKDTEAEALALAERKRDLAQYSHLEAGTGYQVHKVTISGVKPTMGKRGV
jgi:hypothetical protein